DLQQLTDFEQLAGQRFVGIAAWRNVLEWPLGQFQERRGEGRVVVTPPSGTVGTLMPPVLTDGEQASAAQAAAYEWGPFPPVPLPAHLRFGGELTYSFGPDVVTFAPSRFITNRTHVTFEGTTAYGDASRLAFHVTSADWQESDQLLAGIMTDFGARTGPVPFGGRGEFDGVMTGAFRRPRVEGTFTGERLRGFDTIWGDATGHVVVQNNYVT